MIKGPDDIIIILVMSYPVNS